MQSHPEQRQLDPSRETAEHGPRMSRTRHLAAQEGVGYAHPARVARGGIVDEGTGGLEPVAAEARIQTFLIADVRGYTLFTQQRGDEAAAKLAAKFARIAREIVLARGGRVVELRGDEALAVFSSARQAVAAAVDLQERLVDETIDDPALPLPVGIGLDAGEAVPVEEGYRGGALNLAARLCGQAGPGEILASRGVTHLARRVDGVRYVDRGKVHLKNLPEPVEMVRIVPEGADPAARLRAALPPAGPLKRRSPARIAIAAVAAVAVVAAATIILLLNDAEPTIAAGTVGFLSPSGDLEGTVDVGEFPRGLASGAGSLWVADQGSSRLLQVDPSTFQVKERIPVGAGPTGVAIAEGLVWVANTDDRTVSMVDPQAHDVVQTVVVGNGPAGIVADGDRIWVANSVDATVTEIDATDGSIVDNYPVGERPIALAVADGAVWVTNASDGTVSRVVSGDGETQAIPVGRAPGSIASAFGSLWVANAEDGTVTAIDPETGSTTTDRFGEGADALASAGGSIWVASARDGTLLKIDPATKQTDSFDVGNEPRALLGVEGGLWVGVEASAAAHRGGALRLVAERRLNIDPHVGEFVSTTVLASTYDGLVTHRRAGGAAGLTVVPDLVVSIPTPTDEGLTYTFTLRDGIRFSNGHVLEPQDVVATFERVLVGDKYGRFNVSELVGWSTCTPEDPAGCDLSQGVVPDDEARTVTFHLTRPAPSFLKILATSVFAIVPAGTPIDLGGKPIPASGPYLIDDVGQDGSLVLERNPMFKEWSADAQPDGFADRIEVVTGIDPSEQVAMVERGEADFALSGVPFDLVEELDRRASDQLVRSPWPSIFALSLNTATYPFSNADARRAVAYALEREELVRAVSETSAIRGGDVTAEVPAVTCQILPPSTPGYAPYCPYTRSGAQVEGTWAGPDPSLARRLVQRSGTAGARVTIGMSPCLRSTAASVKDTLEGLGYRVDVETDNMLTDEECSFIALSLDADVSIQGWVWDYASPAQFLVPLLSCVLPKGSPPFEGMPAVTGTGDYSFNFSHFCDPKIDGRMRRALDVEQIDPYASARAFEAIDHDLVDQGPMIPYASAVDLWFVSKRVSNVEFNPQIRLIVSQVWIR
jgi:ABC-type transport system substrate-binding protein/class 3 adenylate cyclase